RGHGLRIAGSNGAVHDVVVTGIRARELLGDGITIRDGAYNVVVDHVSIDGCGDGSLDITRKARDVTVAWSVFSRCPKNMLIKYEANRVSIHHNAFVDSVFRNPWLSNLDDGRATTDITADVRNNLVWEWGTGAGTGVECGAKANVVDNFYGSPSSALSDQQQAILVKTPLRPAAARAWRTAPATRAPMPCRST
ncbi:MAG: hypothetical protein L0206_05155, partial [Actinobacteria bacterium]|nr:hypothetical protein [Actinomycetota bacterium]